ncbi:hypothetical protein [Sanguibacter sp. 25GB23B1]|uniref:hypothetical protein n=1 Tax=unclassified Sanguibacter TaxID=2645534 RepID=UPI0032AF9845
MAAMRIDASTTKLGTLGRGSAAAGGSPAQQAYDRAVKHLADAQKKLAQDVVDRAPEETIEVDRAMIEMAAAAVAAAAAALAREQSKDQEAQAPASAEGVERSPRAGHRLGDVDLYA